MKKLKQKIDQAVDILRAGGVIAYPTESVYGLGCDPKNLAAVKKILKIKHRKKEKGLILIASNFAQLKEYLAPIDKDIEEKVLSSWNNSDRAITWLIPANKDVSSYLKGQFDTLAVRVSHHPVVKELCDKFAGAIISTSANVALQEPARTAVKVKEVFKTNIDFILEGETDSNAQPSEIRDVLTDKIIRAII